MTGEAALSWNAEVTYRLQLYMLRYQQDALGDVEALVRRSVRDYPTYVIWRCVHAHMTACLGYTAEAAVALGDAGHAAVLYEALAPYADRVAVSYPEFSMGPWRGISASSPRPPAGERTRSATSRRRSRSTGGSVPARGSRGPRRTSPRSPRNARAEVLAREEGLRAQPAD